MESFNHLTELEQRCKEILKDDEIRFCGFIDSSGKLITGGFKVGVIPLEDDEERRMIFSELAHRITTRKKFDQNLGRVKYSASRREKAVMLSFPIAGKILMITAEPNVNIDRLAYRIIEKLGKQWSEFYGL